MRVHGITFTLLVYLALVTPALAETGKTLEIATGKAVGRTWDQVKADKYAYAPKQDYDAAKKETHIYLPYGTGGPYYDVTGLQLTDPGAEGTGMPLVMSSDGTTSGKLVFKLHFDKPISALRFFAGWSEWGVGGDSVGGVEFSEDGQKWMTIRETSEGKIIEPFADGKKSFGGLKTQDLFIRCYSRDKNNPDADSGPNRWMKFRMGGDPSWGDASSTFFASQMQLWVTTK